VGVICELRIDGVAGFLVRGAVAYRHLDDLEVQVVGAVSRVIALAAGQPHHIGGRRQPISSRVPLETRMSVNPTRTAPVMELAPRPMFMSPAALSLCLADSFVWADRFDRDQQEIFAVQDQVVSTIVATLVGRLEAAGAEQAGRKPPMSLAAYECVLRGVAIPYGNLETEPERVRMFEKAIALDPSYGRPHALLAHAMFLDWFRDMSGSDTVLDHAFRLAKKAVALDENDNTCQFVLGWIHLFRRSFDLAEQYYQRALELNPNNPEQVARMGFLHVFMGRPEAAIEWLKQAKILDPYFNPISHCHALGTAFFVAQHYDEAIAAFSRSSTMPVWVQAYLAACHALTGKIDLAKTFAAEVVRLAPDFFPPACRERTIQTPERSGSFAQRVTPSRPARMTVDGRPIWFARESFGLLLPAYQTDTSELIEVAPLDRCGSNNGILPIGCIGAWE
jgi:tetratricopeptide (TPR) repeat protein